MWLVLTIAMHTYNSFSECYSKLWMLMRTVNQKHRGWRLHSFILFMKMGVILFQLYFMIDHIILHSLYTNMFKHITLHITHYIDNLKHKRMQFFNNKVIITFPKVELIINIDVRIKYLMILEQCRSWIDWFCGTINHFIGLKLTNSWSKYYFVQMFMLYLTILHTSEVQKASLHYYWVIC